MSHQRILATISRNDFVGRDSELRQLIAHSSQVDARRLLILAAPGVGGSEFLRQAYDELFFRRAYSIPVHFAFGKDRLSARDVAADFFRSFLRQFIAYRRVNPALCNTELTLDDLTNLALPTDYEAIAAVVESFERARTDTDETALLRFCLAAPRRLAVEGKHSFYLLIDCLPLADADVSWAAEVAKAFMHRTERAAVAGLRRHVATLARISGEAFDDHQVIHVNPLDDEDSRRLIDNLARRLELDSNEQTRDLIAQQASGSTFAIAAVATAAREAQTPLTSFLNCQRVYVDELLGGRINRHFSSVLAQIAPAAQTRKSLLRMLYKSGLSESGKSSPWSWKKRLGVDANEFERIVDALDVHELLNSSGAAVEINRKASVWMDYLNTQYRIEIDGEPRALAAANMLLDTLKRAPQTMARKYRQAAAVGLVELLTRFNCQQIPASLFHHDRFAAEHKGSDCDSVNAALDAEADLIRLPQIVQVADAKSLSSSIQFEEKRCVVAHGFDAGEYTDENETVWIAAEIDAKVEADVELTKESCDRLGHLAREWNLNNVRLWLVSREGFSTKAAALLKERNAYSSSHLQVEILASRLESEAETAPAVPADEYEMVIPMSEDTELIAARTVEQIARRINFRPDAINQIKLALVEACINAAEHSLSPDRKIYQRFRVENDKLVVIVSSRGVMPANVSAQNGYGNGKSRRGWGLKLIRSLMDEVEFERVDDGTQLRMTKYIRK